MDCKAAREQLEAVRVGTPDLHDPAFEEAAAHLEGCADCTVAFEQQQRFDERLGEAVRNVDVPAGAKAALLEKLASADVAPATPATPRRISRRLMWTVSSVAAVALAVGALTWTLWPNPPQQFSIADLRRSAPLAAEGLPAFDGNFAAALPQVFQHPDPELKVGTFLGGVSLSDDKTPHVAAVVNFELAGRHPVRGALLIVPAKQLKKRPKAEYIDQSPVVYTSRGTTHYASATWGKGDMVYICFVQGSDEDLRRLKNALLGTAA